MAINLERLKSDVSIIDIAKSLNLTPIKIGSFYTLKEHDSVRINPNKNIYIQNSTGIGGTVIDFVMNFNSCDIKEAIHIIDGFYNGYTMNNNDFTANIKNKKTQNEKNKELIYPKKDNSMKNVFAYLTKTRAIDKEIVNDMVAKKMLYQDVNKNCVFVSKDDTNTVRFINKRGTNTYKRFMQDVPGCDYEHSFFINNDSSKLIITESVIDTLSIMTLLKKSIKNYEEYNYLALSGVSKYDRPIKYHLKQNIYEQIFICLDNDEAGKRAAYDIAAMITDDNDTNSVFIIPPILGKDYNELLQIVSREVKMNNIYDKLIQKMYNEYESFINDIKNYDANTIIDKAYEICIKREVLFQISEFEDFITETEAKMLLLESNSLDCCYNRWLDVEDSFAEDIRCCIKDEASRLADKNINIIEKNEIEI